MHSISFGLFSFTASVYTNAACNGYCDISMSGIIKLLPFRPLVLWLQSLTHLNAPFIRRPYVRRLTKRHPTSPNRKSNYCDTRIWFRRRRRTYNDRTRKSASWNNVIDNAATARLDNPLLFSCRVFIHFNQISIGWTLAHTSSIFAASLWAREHRKQKLCKWPSLSAVAQLACQQGSNSSSR